MCPGLDVPVAPPQGQQVEQMLTGGGNVLTNVPCSKEAARVIYLIQGGKGMADDSPRCADHALPL